MGSGTIRLKLPYPPSVNHYWRSFVPPGAKRANVYVSEEGKAFRRIVEGACLEGGIQPISGRLKLTLDIWPPDRMRRDLDNLLKALMDALQHGGCCKDDGQVKTIHAQMHSYNDMYPLGRAEVILERLPDQYVQEALPMEGAANV